MAVPFDGGPPRRICVNACRTIMWAPDGRYLYIAGQPSSLNGTGTTLAIPIQPGQTFPDLPPSGIRGVEDAAAFPGSRIIEAWNISPGPDPSIFAYVKTTVHRNLFRIPLRDY